MRPAGAAASPGEEPDEHEPDQHEQDHDQHRIEAAAGIFAHLGPALPLGGVAREDAQDPVDARPDAAGKIPGLELRCHGAGDDHLRQGVRQRALEAVADLDPHLALGGGDEEQDAVVARPGAEAPGAKQAVGKVLDRGALKRGHGGDHDLVGGLVLVRLERRGERLPLLRPQQAGPVDDPAGERRQVEGRRRPRPEEPHPQDQQDGEGAGARDSAHRPRTSRSAGGWHPAWR